MGAHRRRHYDVLASLIDEPYALWDKTSREFIHTPRVPLVPENTPYL
jgi:hypothetical protein